MSASPAQTTDL